jgi:hypothetical protein
LDWRGADAAAPRISYRRTASHDALNSYVAQASVMLGPTHRWAPRRACFPLQRPRCACGSSAAAAAPRALSPPPPQPTRPPRVSCGAALYQWPGAAPARRQQSGAAQAACGSGLAARAASEAAAATGQRGGRPHRRGRSQAPSAVRRLRRLAEGAPCHSGSTSTISHRCGAQFWPSKDVAQGHRTRFSLMASDALRELRVI